MRLITLSAPVLPHASPLELLDAATLAGFDGIGLRVGKSLSVVQPFYPVAGNTPLIVELKHRLLATGRIVLDLYTFYLTPELDLDACREQMEVGAELGARNAVVVGYDTHWVRASESFAKICEVANEFGLTATVEFCVQCWPSTLAQTLKLFAEINLPNMAVLLDPKHLLATGATLADLATVDRKYVRYYQFCGVDIDGQDFPPTLNRTVPKTRRLLPHEGIVPLAQWMNALPPGLPISIECAPPPPGISSAEWAKTVSASMRTALNSQAGS